MKQLLFWSILFSSSVFGCIKDWPKQPLADEGIYILTHAATEVLSQCARKSYSADSFWSPTVKQVQLINKRLRDYIKRQKFTIKLDPQSQVSSQYLGYVSGDVEYVYVNVFPAIYAQRAGKGSIPIVSCEPSNKFWGTRFNLKSLEFESFDINESKEVIKKIVYLE